MKTVFLLLLAVGSVVGDLGGALGGALGGGALGGLGGGDLGGLLGNLLGNLTKFTGPICLKIPDQECAEGTKPQRDPTTGCFDCYPKFACNLDQLQKCKEGFTNIPPCGAGERPGFENCCVTCKIEAPKCNKDTLAACKTSLATLPACTEDQMKTPSSLFDKEKCCPTCKVTPKVEANKCTLKDFLEEMKTKRPCQPGERPTFTGECGPSCTRPERACNFEKAVVCHSEIAECAAGQSPMRVEGRCCPSCKPAKPTCEPACGATQLCTRTSWTDATGKCRPSKAMAFVLKAKDAMQKALDSAKIKEAIKEMVRRFCERAENAAICEAHQQDVEDGLEAKVTDGKDADTKDVEVTVATATARRLLSTGDELVSKAVADSDANGGFTLTAAGGVSTSGASSLSAGPALLLLSALALLR